MGVSNLLKRVVNHLLEAHCGGFSKLQGMLRYHFDESLNQTEKVTQETVRTILEADARVFTLSKSYDRIKTMATEYLTFARKAREAPSETASEKASGLRAQTVVGPSFDQKLVEFLDSVLDQNVDDRMLTMQLALFVYGEVKQNRIFDMVCMVVKDMLLKGVDKALKSWIVSQSQSELEFVMAEDPNIRATRARLRETVTRLNRVLGEFEKLKL
eukprot:c18044_g1_i2.p1 GENE.c18044_g1_i2~~c18044_g1_i2.p1  ORF type:complete len:214 (+),score=41.94 c18044_g1_i2:1-642(+)